MHNPELHALAAIQKREALRPVRTANVRGTGTNPGAELRVAFF